MLVFPAGGGHCSSPNGCSLYFFFPGQQDHGLAEVVQTLGNLEHQFPA